MSQSIRTASCCQCCSCISLTAFMDTKISAERLHTLQVSPEHLQCFIHQASCRVALQTSHLSATEGMKDCAPGSFAVLDPR